MNNPQAKDRGQSEENLGSFYMGRMRQPTAPPRRLMPKGVLTLFMLVCFAAILWYAYPQGQEKYSDIDIPVIAASKEPYKFKPDDPGGMEVRHQDSTVFDPLEKDGTRHVEKLRPQTEEPMNKAEVLKSTAPIDQTPHSLDLKSVTHAPEKIMTADNDKDAAAPDTEPGDDQPATANKSDAKPDAATSAAKPDDKPAVAAAPATPVKPAPAKAAPAKAAAPVDKPKAAAGKGPYVQLGAYHDVAGAKKEWALLQKKYPETLGKLQMHTQQVDLGAKGVLTRLQAGAPTDARAKTICDALKADKQACIVVH